jgi:hypothetical protein
MTFRGAFIPDPDRADRIAVARIVLAVLKEKPPPRSAVHPDDFTAALEQLIEVHGLAPSTAAWRLNISTGVGSELLRRVAEQRADRAERRAKARAFAG